MNATKRTTARLSLASFLLAGSFAGGCASTGKAPRIPVTSIGIREIQTRTFEDVDATTAMKAAIDALQDGGFTIDRSDSALGLIVGTRRATHNPAPGTNFLKWTTIAFSYGLSALLPWDKKETTELEASFNVTAIEGGVRIRASLSRRVLDDKGRLSRTEVITEGPVYRDLFESLGRSLFVVGAGS